MSFKRLRSDYPETAEALRAYARKHAFTKSLVELCATTLLRSIAYGDGALWTDSLLIAGLMDPKSSLRTLFDRFPGYRTSQLARTEFASTLSTQHLIIRPEFQSTVAENLTYWGRRGPVDEEALILCDLDGGMERYSDFYFDASSFAMHITRPLHDRDFHRMAYMLQDCFILSLMCHQHPFEAFRKSVRSDVDSGGNGEKSYYEIGQYYPTQGEFNRARRLYYWRVRDVAAVSPAEVCDEELKLIANLFSRDEFIAMCDQLDYAEATIFDHDENPAKGCHDSCYYASALVYDSGLPISFLVERLQSWREHGHSNPWPMSVKLVLSAGVLGIDATMLDLASPTQFDLTRRDATRQLADVGIWTPDLIWTPNVLDRLRFMLSDPSLREQAFQELFEAYPDFVLDDLHVEAYPQVVLFQETGSHLRPDFAVRRRNSRFVDFVEIKRHTDRVVVVDRGRPRLSAAANRAIAQLKEYRDWFRSASNRSWLQREHGLDGFEPRLTVIIGRSMPSINEELMNKAVGGSEAVVMTYDDVAASAERRKLWLP